MVYHLVKEKGMTLEGARQTLQTKKDEVTRRTETVARLREIKKELLLLQGEFDQLHEQQKYSSTRSKSNATSAVFLFSLFIFLFFSRLAVSEKEASMNRTKLSATPEGDVSTHDDSSVTMGAERFDQYLPTLEGQRWQ